nr:MsnO8 family LLM class oxidoreductase [Kocuria atrinae]
MLPNHSPLTIAEQFGTLAELYPGRIDLGLGRAPGTDQRTLQALRRSPQSADSFPQDVKELQGYLSGTPAPRRRRHPRRQHQRAADHPGIVTVRCAAGGLVRPDLRVRLALRSGCLVDAVNTYRTQFQPSEQLAEPYVIAAVNVIVSEDPEDAARQLEATQRARVRMMVGRGREFTEDEMDMVMASPAAQQILHMLKYMAVGTPDTVVDYLERFAQHADADELMISPVATRQEDVLKGMELLANAWKK